MAETREFTNTSTLAAETVVAPGQYDEIDLQEIEQMPQAELQDMAVRYLLKVLEWLFRVERWYIPQDLLIRHPAVPDTRPIAPDIAVFVDVRRKPVDVPIKSWTIRPPECPPPTVVFEVASDYSWRKDLDQKPPDYAVIGAAEYFAFDSRPESIGVRPPVRGWRNSEGVPVEIEPDEQGRLWSSALGSWVVADGRHLRLQDADGNVRLTGEEAERAAKEQERAARRRERAAKERERAAKERAWAKLRELGIDPESLEPPAG